MPMSPKEVEERMERIRKSMGDPEEAHSREDELYFDFIKSVAEIPERENFTLSDLADIVNNAKLILETEDFNFPRWYA